MRSRRKPVQSSVFLFSLLFFSLFAAASSDEPIHVFEHPNSPLISNAALSPDGRKVVTGSTEAIVWDTKTGDQLITLHEETDHISAVAFSEDGNWVVTGDWDTYVRIWDVGTGKELFSVDFDGPDLHPPDSGFISSVALSHGGEYVAAGTVGPHFIRVWDVASGELVFKPTWAVREPPYYLAFLPGGNRILIRRSSVTNEGWAEIWDIPTGTVVRTFEGFGARLSSDSKRVVTAHDFKEQQATYSLWDAESGNRILSVMNNHITTMFGPLGPDGAILVTYLREGLTRFTHMQSNSVLKEDSYLGAPILTHQTMSKDGKLMLTAEKKKVYLWDVSDLTAAVGDSALYNE